MIESYSSVKSINLLGMWVCRGPKLSHFSDSQVDSRVEKSKSCQREDASDKKNGPMKIILDIVLVIPWRINSLQYIW